MAGKGVLPRLAMIIAGLGVVFLLASHVNDWMFAPPESGSHVQRDFAQAGFTFTPAQRIAGAVIEGLPKVAFGLALLALAPLLWSPRTSPAASARILSRASRVAVVGAVLLAVYPAPASIVLSQLEPGAAGMFLVSLQPVVMIALVGALVFAAVSTRISGHLRSAPNAPA